MEYLKHDFPSPSKLRVCRFAIREDTFLYYRLQERVPGGRHQGNTQESSENQAIPNENLRKSLILIQNHAFLVEHPRILGLHVSNVRKHSGFAPELPAGAKIFKILIY